MNRMYLSIATDTNMEQVVEPLCEPLTINHDYTTSTNITFDDCSTRAWEIVQQTGWTTGQRRLLQHFHETLVKIHDNGGKPFLDNEGPIVLCTGGPGTGKQLSCNNFQKWQQSWASTM